MERTIATLIAGGHPFDFDELALGVSAYQYAENEPYRRYCDQRGHTPDTVEDWRRIPPVATRAFKIVDLACGLPERVFLTSGTTRGLAQRGRHLIPHLALYRHAALTQFAACVTPDLERREVLSLTPPPALRPESSLVHMVEWIREAHGTEDSAYFVSEQGLDAPKLCERLGAATAKGDPLFLIGITAAFEDLFAHCQHAGKAFRLPYGTVIIDTGGNKRGPGSRSLSRAGFLHACWRVLNVPAYHCINEYGMTELCSQFYDNAIHERRAGRFTPRHKIGPPWTRTRVVDPDTLEEAPPGRPGLLQHFDLANCGSVLAVQTEDLGVTVGNGFEITGRLRGAEPRGCALLLEAMTRNDAPAVASPTRSR
jgi:hypothetical protein